MLISLILMSLRHLFFYFLCNDLPKLTITIILYYIYFCMFFFHISCVSAFQLQYSKALSAVWVDLSPGWLTTQLLKRQSKYINKHINITIIKCRKGNLNKNINK